MKFTVLGEPIPQGSLKSGISKRGKVFVTSDNKRTMPWRQQVAWAALREMKGGEPAGSKVPIRVMIAFYFERPKSVKGLAEKTTKPDL